MRQARRETSGAVPRETSGAVRCEPFDVALAGCLAAVEADLGRLRRQYRWSAKPSPLRFGLGVGYLALGAWLIRGVAVELWHPGATPVGGQAFLGLVMMVGLAAGALGGVLLQGYRRPAQWWFGRLDHGVVVSCDGGQPLALRWDQLVGVTYTPSRLSLPWASDGARHQLSFFFVDGSVAYRLKRLPAADWVTRGPEVVEAFQGFWARGVLGA